MLSSTSAVEKPFCNKNLKTLSCSCSSCASCSCNNNKANKSMEEVWKDINLACLNNNIENDHSSSDHDLSLAPPPPPPPPPVSNLSFILQDFFTRPQYPRGTDPPSSATIRTDAATLSGGHSSSRARFGSLVPVPGINLSLNSSGPPGFDHFNTVIHGLELDSSPPAPCSNFGNKRRIHHSGGNIIANSCDRRHKRMIKNRESAARSRARKQAYTQELENTVNQLNEENARLRKEQKKIYMAAASQLPKTHTLHRTSTAPF